MNCLFYALLKWKYKSIHSMFAMRKSLHAWFPHWMVFEERSDGTLIKREYVPDPKVTRLHGRLIPPIFFKGIEKVTKYVKVEE